MRRRLLAALTAFVIAVVVFAYVGAPYARAASFIVRAAGLGGRAEEFANRQSRKVTIQPRHQVSTRYGDVPARMYVPEGTSRRTVLLVPGIHSMGIEEPRLTALADDLAGAGVKVMAMALPDLQAYRITPRATDVIEDAVTWMSQRPDLAPDGRVGIIGISFAGGLSISAASRPSIRDKVAFVLSFGGHGDLYRVMRYLTTGEAPQVPGLETHPPHDYGVAVILYGLADRGVVPMDQVEALRKGIETFLLASQLTLVNMDEANATFAKAREIARTLPEPSRTYLNYVNDRAVAKLGPALVPFLQQLGVGDPALSPQLIDHPASATLFLLHGSGDTVIPAAETVLFSEDLQRKGADVHVLLSELITHAEVNRAATYIDVLKLVNLWAQVFKS
jgi:Dienelactone hydrolase and related enzymes